MKLGKGPKGGGAAPSSLLQAMAAEADESSIATPSRPGLPTATASPGSCVAAGITLTAEEKISIIMSRDGGLQVRQTRKHFITGFVYR